MVFSSWQFILLFLPITFAVYFWLNGRRFIIGGKVWLVLASLFFYGFWDIRYLPLILGSILLNFAIGTGLAQSHKRVCSSEGTARHGVNRKIVLVTGIAANLLLLAYYKYTSFLFDNLNWLMGLGLSHETIVLPLAISFFTFTQIVYLVDSYKGETAEYDLLNYMLFVTFFPHLIAGPIVHHRQIMPQFSSRWTLAIRTPAISRGLFIFAIGLFKKVVIADNFSLWATAGFDGGQPLGFFAAWTTSLSYTLQLYFDFSGYCDMAIGASLLFNIWLPVNFNSPYKALSIQDFWRRWHITLSAFLRDFLYIPLGGNQGTLLRTSINVLITFLLGGLWHGASWMFVIWGGLHGSALICHRFWQRLGRPLPASIAWLITFLFVNFTWVFFRAKTIDDAIRVLKGMAGIGNTGTLTPATSQLAWAGWLSDELLRVLPHDLVGQLPVLVAIGSALFMLTRKNSIQLVLEKVGTRRLVAATLLLILSINFLLATTSSVFLYFNF